MVTWNRREYFARSVANVLADPSDFRLCFWDNASSDGVRDIIAGLKDERIAAKHFADENVGQFQPWHWFLENCSGDIIGKLDDDIIGEHGWMARFANMISEFSQLGVLGAWVYLRSEWDETAARHKFTKVGPYTIFQNLSVPGGIFLARRSLLEKFSSKDPTRLGVPIQQSRICKAGFINGYPYPISFADHLDDPRSPHCRMNRPGGWDQFAAYSARMRHFSGPAEYGRWIAADARKVLETSVQEQLRNSLPSPVDKLKLKVRRRFTKVRRLILD
jgi:glycosyltransferase involved in cell wall biosynthesis